jgi:hypothetical protein
MADFGTHNEFRKGYKLGKTNQFADPTYLSFSLMFDFFEGYSSPLLAGPARAFLKNQLEAEGDIAEVTDDEGLLTTQASTEYTGEYGHRLKALDDFIFTLKKINKEMPWYWQSLSGLDALQKYDPLPPYRGGDESVISIGTLESIDLTIAGLMHLYRTACFDEKRWSYILPPNLREFRVWIYVTECRPIKNLSKISASLGFDKDSAKDSLSTLTSGGGLKGVKDIFNPTIGVQNANADISGSNKRPYFMFELGSCEWDMTTGTAQFADLLKTPEGFAASEIAFRYKKVSVPQARVLNGTIIETNKQSANLSPANSEESKAYGPGDFKDFIGDKIKGKIGEMGDRFVDDATLFMDKKKQQIGQLGSDIYRANVPNFENIYTNMVNQADKDTDISALSKNMPENVLGLKKGATVQDGFDQSATAGLNIGENIYQDATADGGGDAAVSDLGNVNDAAPTDGGTGGNNNLGNIHE